MRDVDNEMERLLEELGIHHPRCGAYVGAGWFPIVERALRAMVDAGWDRELHQIKQKFCGLRIYVGATSDEVDAIIDEADRLCSAACEECGEPHGLETPRYGIALCRDCAEREGRLYGD